MKTTFRFLPLVVALTLVLFVFAQTSVFADSGSASYEYLVGSGVVCTIPGLINPCPDLARASNGETITVAGSGTLSIHPNSVSGSGTFIEKDAVGALLESGTWTATQLLGFHSYGTMPGVPPSFVGGHAVIRVQLSPAAGGPGEKAILQVYCTIGTPPPIVDEGIKLAVQGGPNFNKQFGGNTLFVRLP